MRYIWILVLGWKHTCLRVGIIVIGMHDRGDYNAVRRMNDPHYVLFVVDFVSFFVER
jgi:hypothetical protein